MSHTILSYPGEDEASKYTCDISNLLCPAIGSAEYCNERVCLSVCLCVCLSAIISPELHVRSSPIFVHVTYGRGSVLLWRHSDNLRISGFVDDAIFAHKLTGCSTSPLGRDSEAHTYDAALSLARRNTCCRQRTLGTTSCNQSRLVGVVVPEVANYQISSRSPKQLRYSYPRYK